MLTPRVPLPFLPDISRRGYAPVTQRATLFHAVSDESHQETTFPEISSGNIRRALPVPGAGIEPATSAL